VRVIGPDHPWVSRGGIKLAAALDAFGIDATDRVVFDVGASTGGFTDVWLQRGARHVIALDVGHSQLHWKVRSDPRVTVIENTNARYLKPGDLKDAGAPITRVSIDVFDATGKRVRATETERRKAGPTRLDFDGLDGHSRPLPSGIYFYRVRAGDEMMTKKIVIAR